MSICIWNRYRPIVPGEIVVLTMLKICDRGAHISHVVLLLSPHSFLVRKDPLCGRSDVQGEITQLGHHICIRVDS